MNRGAVIVQGMHGLGDNIHQRGILRALMANNDVWLESSWVSIYHDLIGEGLKVVNKLTSLRTQTKNAQRERASFSKDRAPLSARRLKIWYPPAEVRAQRSVFGAMCKAAGVDAAQADFRLPIPAAWSAKAQAWCDTWRPHKPLLIYRPLVMRTEWSGCAARNPDQEAYAALFDAIRDLFFVVSVADLVPRKEWQVGLACEADATCHAGELDIETLAALTARAAMVFASPGFMVPLSQAVGTPVVCTFGGYERGYSFSSGARFAPYLPIEPVNPCDCFSHDHACRKSIYLPDARARARVFALDAAARAAGRAGRRAD